MTLYIYRLADNVIVATVTGTTNEECEAKADATLYSTNDHGWSYTDSQLIHAQSPNNTPTRFISAYSWNSTEFYFNTCKLTWERAEDTCLTAAHDATDADIAEAMAAARREDFAADRIAIHQYVEA